MDTLDLAGGHEALATGVVVPAPGRGLLELTGPQAVWFLQNTVTADVEQVPEGAWTPSCFLDPKGKVMAHFRVGVVPGLVWLDVDAPGTDTLADWFQRYRFRTKVEIADRTTTCSVVLGPPARDLAEDRMVVRTSDGVVFGDTIGEVPAAFVHGPQPDLGLPTGPEELLRVVTVEAGLGTFGIDYGSDTLPQEAGLTHELSVTKGCYVGQEVVARLHFRGHVNKVLRRLAFGSDRPGVGAVLIHEGQRVGKVTSAIGPVGIGMVRVAVPEGARLDAEGGGTATVGPVPAGTKTERTPPVVRAEGGT